MQAIIVNQFGGPEQLSLQDVADAQGEVIVEAHWAGINYVDIYQREGRYPGIREHWPMGIEGSGIVLSAPADSGWQVGDRVAYTTGVQGSYAERVAVPARHLLAVPAGISLQQACAALEHGLTALILIEQVARLPKAARVLVHAAAGGVGGWLVQLLIARGHTVFGTVSAEAKAAWLTELGAIPLRYDLSTDWLAELRQHTKEQGVDVVFDSVGRATFSASTEALATCGHLIVFGAASGQVEAIDILQLMRKSLTLTRPVLPHYLLSPGRLQHYAAMVFEAVRTKQVQLRIHATYPLAEVAQAHRDLASRQTQGKLLLALPAQAQTTASNTEVD